MRIVFVGASEEAVLTTRMLVKQGHEVVIVDADQEKLKQIFDELGCAVLHGDGAKPAILKEVNPENTDVLFCLSNNDQVNVIAGLVGRSLGFKRVVPSIVDSELEPICRELGLENTIIPSRTVSRHLVDMALGLDSIELSTVLKDEARFFTFTASKQDAIAVGELELPQGARAICNYRGDNFHFADEITMLREGDEVILLTLSKDLPTLRERWDPKQTDKNNG
jgi:trk/ktr system potassium uptake protein